MSYTVSKLFLNNTCFKLFWLPIGRSVFERTLEEVLHWVFLMADLQLQDWRWIDGFSIGCSCQSPLSAIRTFLSKPVRTFVLAQCHAGMLGLLADLKHVVGYTFEQHDGQLWSAGVAGFLCVL